MVDAGTNDDAVPDHLAREITGNVLAGLRKERPKRPSRAVFGIKGFDVVKFVISMAAAVIVAYYGMQFAIERNTAAIERNGGSLEKVHDTIEIINTKVSTHKEGDHKELDDRVRKVERTTDRIEIMQTQTLDVLKEVKEDLRAEQRRDRRRR